MKIMRRVALIGSTAALLAACQTTDANRTYTNRNFASGTRAAADAAASGEGEVECRRERRIGTLIPRTLCMTAEEWAAAEAASREAGDRIEQMSTVGDILGP